MKMTRRLLLLTGIALAGGYSTAAGDMLKCPSPITLPGYEEEPVVVLVDGKVADFKFSEGIEIDSEEIWVEILCWDPTTGDFAMGAGVAGGVNVLSFVTEDAPSEERVAAVRKVANKALQELWDEAPGGGPGGER